MVLYTTESKKKPVSIDTGFFLRYRKIVSRRIPQHSQSKEIPLEVYFSESYGDYNTKKKPASIDAGFIDWVGYSSVSATICMIAMWLASNSATSSLLIPLMMLGIASRISWLTVTSRCCCVLRSWEYATSAIF